MALSKKQKQDRWNYFGSLAVIVLVFIALFCAYGCESKPDQVDPGYVIFVNSDSLEVANPDYLVKYFDSVDLIWANNIEE